LRIGIPRESKEGERRVGLEPSAVDTLARDGHEVRVAAAAGLGIGATDADYASAGASIVDPADAWNAELVIKVKEIQHGEWNALARGSTLCCFQHFVGEPLLAREVAARGVTAIAYEMVRGADGGFPLLAPMSVIAGRLAIQVGAQLLTLPSGGNGTLLAGCPGAQPARVLVLGGGHAGINAAEVAAALGARVVLLTRSAATRDRVAARFAIVEERARGNFEEQARGNFIETGVATPEAVERHALAADLVVGAVFVPGEPTPKLLPRALVARMKPGSVIVDISIDAGGVAETSRPTTHADPTYVEEGVVHYCVPNMPSAVARAGAAALSAAVLPYARALAGKGIARAIREDAGLRAGVLLWHGRFTHEGIATAAGRPFAPLTGEDLA
jgi:alanine dehydrogenase